MNISLKVAEQIARSGKDIEAQIIELLAAKEVDRRVNAVLAAYAEVVEIEKALKKMKPDVVTYKDNGEIASSDWTKKKLDERNNLQEKLNRLTRSIDKALDLGDFSDLLNFKKADSESESA